MSDPRATRGGVSMVELTAVGTILGVIAAIIVPRVAGANAEATARLNEHNVATINAAIEQYYVDSGAWPSADLRELEAPEYFEGGVPVNPVDGSPYTMDPASNRVN